MNLPSFTRTLHFRVSASFLLLLAVVAGGFWFWLNATILSADVADEEANWYENLAEGQLDSLAGKLGQLLGRGETAGNTLVEYGQTIDRFDAEVILFDPRGVNLKYLSNRWEGGSQRRLGSR